MTTMARKHQIRGKTTPEAMTATPEAMMATPGATAMINRTREATTAKPNSNGANLSATTKNEDVKALKKEKEEETIEIKWLKN